MTRRLVWLAVAGCLACAGSGDVLADEDAYRLEEVTVKATPLDDAPFLPSVSGTRIHAGKKTRNIPLDQAPAIVNNNYRQVLAKTPGLLLSEESTPLLSLGYRGLDPHRAQFTQVLKDGVPIHADMFGYPEAYYTPPLQSIDRLEFIHGGASLMYGPQPGGALNFITKQPDADTPLAVSTEHAAGTDELWSHYTSFSGLQEPLGYRGYLHERQSNGFRETNSDVEVIGGGLRTTLGQTTDARWTLDYDEYHEEHGEPGGLTKAVADTDGRDRTTRFNDRFRLERYYATLIHERDLGEDSRLDLRLFGGHYRRYSKRQDGGGFGTAATGSTNTIEEQDFYTVGVEPRFRHTYDALGYDDWAWTAGALVYFSDSPREDQRGSNPAADSGSLRNKSERDTQYLSLFAEHLFKVGPWSVTPGVRLEHIWQQLQEEVNVSKTAVPLAEADEFDFVPLFGMGTAYDLGAGVEWYANVSQSYRPKIFAQAIPSGALQIVNNDLDEGRGWLTDVGLRGTHAGGAASWDVSTFVLRFDDQIGTAGNTVDNVGDARHLGLEFMAEADLVRLYDIAEHTAHGDRVGSLSPFINAMLLDAKFVQGPQEGKTPQYAPQYTMRFGAEYRWPARAKLRLSSTFVDSHFADDANTATRFIPSYKIWDLTGELAVWRDIVTVFGGVNNVFDERYYARIRSDGIDPAYERNLYGGVRARVRF